MTKHENATEMMINRIMGPKNGTGNIYTRFTSNWRNHWKSPWTLLKRLLKISMVLERVLLLVLDFNHECILFGTMKHLNFLPGWQPLLDVLSKKRKHHTPEVLKNASDRSKTLLWMTVQTPPWPSLCCSTSAILTSATDMSEVWLDCKY